MTLITYYLLTKFAYACGIPSGQRGNALRATQLRAITYKQITKLVRLGARSLARRAFPWVGVVA